MYYYVYMMASKKDGVIYIGVTNDLKRRVYEHKNKIIKGFTSRYKAFKLVYYEYGSGIEGAIAREKELKKYKRIWKVELIERQNKNWDDLFHKL